MRFLEDEIAQLKKEGRLLRPRVLTGPQAPVSVVDGKKVVNLTSNNYLDLTEHPKLKAAAKAAVDSHGVGTAAVRTIIGTQDVHVALEKKLAEFKGTQAALAFQSGFTVNVACCSSLMNAPEDLLVSDELNHASIIDGCRLSGAEVRVYRHGDPEHAAALLADAPGRRLLVTDGVFSMDGDLAPLPALCDAAERHGAMVVVDDAHGSGVLGPDGRGTVAHLGCEDRVHAIVATCSKALGSTGGYVAGSSRLVEWLTNRARAFVFDTALGAPAVAAARAAVEVLRAEPDRRARPVAHARRLAAAVRAAGWDVPEPEAAIVPVMIGENHAAMAAMESLLARGVLAVAIRPPTVPAGTARLRATLMATHSDADVDLAITAFGDALAAAA